MDNKERRNIDLEYHELMNSGKLYDCRDKEVVAYQYQLLDRLSDFNRTRDTPEGLKEREAILREITGTYGENLYMLPPVSSNWGLKHVHFGKDVFVNFNSNFVDDADVFIGDDTMIGPNCTIATANHPISPRLRKHKFQYNKPVHIGKNVWLGSGVIVLPGVTIGDNSIVGAGSVVTKNVEANTVVVGNPARVLRKITEKDDRFYDGKEIPQDIIDEYLK
jgi:galactoside O-acetyltransferase